MGAELATGLDSYGGELKWVHAHDWHAGLAAAYSLIKVALQNQVFTIHNLAYQGQFAHHHLHEIGLPEGMFHVNGFRVIWPNFIFEAGLYYSDMVTQQ